MTRGLVLLAAPLLLLSGCLGPAADSIVLTPAEVDLAPCAPGDPVPVDALTVAAECDLAGHDILYPDGHIEVAPEIAGNQQTIADDDAWSLCNLGTHGLVAGHRHAGGETEWWGTRRGIELYVATGDYPGEGVAAFD